MHVLDPANIVDVVDQNAAPKGLSLHVSDQVPLIMLGVDAVVGVEQFNREHGRVFAAHRNGPGIRGRFFIDLLIRVIQNHAFEGAVMVQGDESSALFVAAPFGDEEGCAIVGWPRRPRAAYAHVGGDRFPHSPQCDRWRHCQVAGKKIDAARGIHLASASLSSCIQGFLECRCVIGFCISARAKIEDGKQVVRGCRNAMSSQAKEQGQGSSQLVKVASRDHSWIVSEAESVSIKDPWDEPGDPNPKSEIRRPE